MPDSHKTDGAATKDRIGAFIHHPVTSLVVVVAIVLSVSLVMVHLLLSAEHRFQEPIEHAQIALTVFFFVELSTKFYVAPSKSRFFAGYWVDIIAILPWTQSLRVLRVLRLLRVFRVAIILSRRVRFVSAIFRSAVGEYLVLSMIMLTLLTLGTFVLYVTESRARTRRDRQALEAGEVALSALEARAEGRAAPAPASGGPRQVPDSVALRSRAKALAERLDQETGPGTQIVLSERDRRAALNEVDEILAAMPPPRRLRNGERAKGDLAEFENSFWATLYFLVATEPMISTPTTTVGRIVVLAVMFGGLTTFAIFTGVVTALMVNRLKRRMEIDDMDRFQLNDHLLICGWNRLVPLIIKEITESPTADDKAIVIVADVDEPPAEIAALQAGSRVYFVRGDYTKPEWLNNARVRQARLAIIVADDTTQQRSDQDRDARTVLAALMIERMSPGIYTCAELLNRDNEPHLRAAGIEEVIVTSEVGGHHLAMAAQHAGITEVLSKLLNNKAGKNLIKVAVPEDQVGKTFADILLTRKTENDDLVIGLEVKGQDGPRKEGYAMLVNPKGEVVLGERDNLVVIASPLRKRPQ